MRNRSAKGERQRVATEAFASWLGLVAFHERQKRKLSLPHSIWGGRLREVVAAGDRNYCFSDSWNG